MTHAQCQTLHGHVFDPPEENFSFVLCIPYTCIHSMFRRYKGEEKRGNVRKIHPLWMVEWRKERAEGMISARVAWECCCQSLCLRQQQLTKAEVWDVRTVGCWNKNHKLFSPGASSCPTTSTFSSAWAQSVIPLPKQRLSALTTSTLLPYPPIPSARDLVREIPFPCETRGPAPFQSGFLSRFRSLRQEQVVFGCSAGSPCGLRNSLVMKYFSSWTFARPSTTPPSSDA